MQLNPLALALTSAGMRRYSPNSLFLDGSQGFWLDASDRSTLFQDSAGTTPVTALGDPVGRWIDKSGRGNHFVQTTSGARPVWGSWPLSAAIAGRVRNLLIQTEDISSAAWGKTRTTTPNATTLVETADGFTHLVNQALGAVTSGLTYTTTTTLEKGLLATAPDIMQLTYDATRFASGQFANVNVLTGEVISTAGGATCTSQADPLGGWRFTYTATASSTGSGAFFNIYFCANNPSAVRAPSYTGSITSDVRIYRTQPEQAATATAYQRVGVSSRYDVSEAGQPQVYFVSPDGVDDFLVSAANVDFSATDRMFVCAGVTKKSDAAAAAVVEHTGNINANNGGFILAAPTNPAPNYVYGSKGTIRVDVTATTFSAPITNVLSGVSRISTDAVSLSVNGGSAFTDAADQGTGNYANALTYLCARAGTSLFSSANIYQLVAVGKTPTTSELNATETFVAAKTKGSLT